MGTIAARLLIALSLLVFVSAAETKRSHEEVAGADLPATKVTSPDPANSGSNGTHRISVKNNRRDSASNASRPDKVPTGPAIACTTNPIVTTNADSGAGSLRAAIQDACAGSTITFSNVISPPAVPVPVRFTNFLRDTQEIGAGVIVGQGNWQAQLDNNKGAFALSFVQRPAFLVRYPGGTGATEFVDALNANAGSVLSGSERSVLISELSPNPADPALRASVLRKVAEDATLRQQEFNRAFVLMQYFGYLRRNPDAAPEGNLNFAGYNFWLNKLNEFNGNFVNADMVKSFLTAGEYRGRFGP